MQDSAGQRRTVKNGRQEPYPVWHFKNIKERGVWGEVVKASVPLGASLALYPGRCSKRGTTTHGNDRPQFLNLNCSTYWPVVGLIYLRFLGACFEPLMSRASAKVCPAASKRSLMQVETALKSDLSQAWPRKCAQGGKWSAST